MKNKLEALIETRKLITFAVAGVFVWKSLADGLNQNFIENVILMVLTYYFSKSTALDKSEK